MTCVAAFLVVVLAVYAGVNTANAASTTYMTTTDQDTTTPTTPSTTTVAVQPATRPTPATVPPQPSSKRCHCKGDVDCVNNAQCPDGCEKRYYGSHCKKRCGEGKYRINGRCVGDCHCRTGFSDCYVTNGSCSKGCTTRFRGPRCSQCTDGLHGSECRHICHCLGENKCAQSTGACANGCAAGYRGVNCLRQCPRNKLGLNCTQTCHCSSIGDTCNPPEWTCRQCAVGYGGVSCQNKCTVASRTFGSNCSYTCHCKGRARCNTTTGLCPPGGCEPLYYGDSCSVYCNGSTFGVFCNHTCHCQDTHEQCHLTGGVCTSGCAENWDGPMCQQFTREGSRKGVLGPHGGAVVLASVGSMLVVLGLVVAAVAFRQRDMDDEVKVDIQYFDDTSAEKLGYTRGIPNPTVPSMAKPGAPGIIKPTSPDMKPMTDPDSTRSQRIRKLSKVIAPPDPVPQSAIVDDIGSIASVRESSTASQRTKTPTPSARSTPGPTDEPPTEPQPSRSSSLHMDSADAGWSQDSSCDDSGTCIDQLSANQQTNNPKRLSAHDFDVLSSFSGLSKSIDAQTNNLNQLSAHNLDILSSFSGFIQTSDAQICDPNQLYARNVGVLSGLSQPNDAQRNNTNQLFAHEFDGLSSFSGLSKPGDAQNNPYQHIPSLYGNDYVYPRIPNISSRVNTGDFDGISAKLSGRDIANVSIPISVDSSETLSDIANRYSEASSQVIPSVSAYTNGNPQQKDETKDNNSQGFGDLDLSASRSGNRGGAKPKLISDKQNYRYTNNVFQNPSFDPDLQESDTMRFVVPSRVQEPDTGPFVVPSRVPISDTMPFVIPSRLLYVHQDGSNFADQTPQCFVANPGTMVEIESDVDTGLSDITGPGVHFTTSMGMISDMQYYPDAELFPESATNIGRQPYPDTGLFHNNARTETPFDKAFDEPNRKEYIPLPRSATFLFDDDYSDESTSESSATTYVEASMKSRDRDSVRSQPSRQTLAIPKTFDSRKTSPHEIDTPIVDDSHTSSDHNKMDTAIADTRITPKHEVAKSAESGRMVNAKNTQKEETAEEVHDMDDISSTDTIIYDNEECPTMTSECRNDEFRVFKEEAGLTDSEMSECDGVSLSDTAAMDDVGGGIELEDVCLADIDSGGVIICGDITPLGVAKQAPLSESSTGEKG